RGDRMRRRDFIWGLGGATAGSMFSWPFAARAQQAERMRRIGWLDLVPESDPGAQARVTVVRQGLGRLGWTGRPNLANRDRWGGGGAGAELLARAPDVILCGGSPAVQALQQASSSGGVSNKVPVVFVLVAEPVAQGFVQSLGHPGGHITGFSYLEPTVGAKWLELLKQIAPRVTRVAYVFSPTASPYAPLFYKSIEGAAATLGVQTIAAPAREPPHN